MAADTPYELKIFSPTGDLIDSFVPFTEGAPGSMTAADLGQDGIAEIVVGAGTNLEPWVRVFRQDGTLINEFLAYDVNFRGGVNVAACDLDGDGQSEILTGAGYTGGPHVRAFEADGSPTNLSLFAYDRNFRGGVNVACGDVTGDSQPEIITGAGATGGPHVRVFNAHGLMIDEIFTGSAQTHTGTYVTLGNTDGDAALEILAAPMAFSSPMVTTVDWDGRALKLQQTISTGTSATYGTPVTAFDTNEDGQDEIAVSEGAFGSSSVQIFNPSGTSLSAIETGLNASSSTIQVATLTGSHEDLLLALASSTLLANTSTDQYIKVDISEQRLTAYEHGIPVKTFLVSTGTYRFPTPLGSTTITDKIPVMTYAWSYGVGNPNNYSLPGVKYNLRFRKHLYIHSAYWHNNFGQRMSHGCVNTSIPDAEWIYNWANVGATVEIVN